MAKHRKGRRVNWNKFRSGTIEMDLAMTTLAAKTLTLGTTELVKDTARVSSIECVYGMSGLTPADGVGPFLFGVAHSDYTAAEIEAFIESAGSWDIGDKIAQEIRTRRVRIIGQLGGSATGTGLEADASFNDGRPQKTKLNWTLAEDDGLDLWIYNMGDQPVSTTISQFVVFGSASIWYD